MKPTEEQFEQIADGKRSSFIIQELKPALLQLRDNYLDEMKSLNRSGSVTEGKLLAVSAKLCTLDDIEEHFKAKISISEDLTKRLQEKENEND